jgi:hypothetical protein
MIDERYVACIHACKETIYFIYKIEACILVLDSTSGDPEHMQALERERGKLLKLDIKCS